MASDFLQWQRHESVSDRLSSVVLILWCQISHRGHKIPATINCFESTTSHFLVSCLDYTLSRLSHCLLSCFDSTVILLRYHASAILILSCHIRSHLSRIDCTMSRLLVSYLDSTLSHLKPPSPSWLYWNTSKFHCVISQPPSPIWFYYVTITLIVSCLDSTFHISDIIGCTVLILY